jgi:CBS domain-containing protein
LEISDVMQPSPPGNEGAGTGRLLLEEGTDLLAADKGRLKRGTPVYVHASADVNEVQRQMALKHIKLLPVLSNGEVVGLVDLMDLVRMQARDTSGEDDRLGRPA